jgi:hypothetical protein
VEVVVNLVRGKPAEDLAGELLPRHPHLDVERARRVEEAAHVLLEAEDGAGVDPDPLEDAVSEVQAAAEHRHCRLVLRHQPAVQVDEQRPVDARPQG